MRCEGLAIRSQLAAATPPYSPPIMPRAHAPGLGTGELSCHFPIKFAEPVDAHKLHLHHGLTYASEILEGILGGA